MQQKGERENMTNGECCRYIRTYSELEGLQHACTLVYCAASTPQGVLAQLRREQGGKVQQHGACPGGQLWPGDAAAALPV